MRCRRSPRNGKCWLVRRMHEHALWSDCERTSKIRHQRLRRGRRVSVDCYCSAKSTINWIAPDRPVPSDDGDGAPLRSCGLSRRAATGAVPASGTPTQMSIPTSFMLGGDLHGAVYWSHCRLQQMRTRAVWDRRVSNDTARNSPPKHVADGSGRN